MILKAIAVQVLRRFTFKASQKKKKVILRSRVDLKPNRDARIIDIAPKAYIRLHQRPQANFSVISINDQYRRGFNFFLFIKIKLTLIVYASFSV